MVHVSVSPYQPRAWRSNEMKDRNSLRLASHDSGQRSGRSDIICGAQDRGAVNTRIAVRRISRVELIAAAYPRETFACLDRLIDWEGEIPRHAKGVPDTEGCQSLHDI